MNPETPQEFWDVADEFIEFANLLAIDYPMERVSAAMMYAAARFNAYNACREENARHKQEQIVAYYSKQYRSMFRDNIDDHLSSDSSQN